MKRVTTVIPYFHERFILKAVAFLFMVIILFLSQVIPHSDANEAHHPGFTRPYRARDLGIRVGRLPTGPLNAITDVHPVRVGHLTIVKGANIRTGLTVIIPHPGNLFQEKVPGAVVVGNGFGKLVGSTQVMELGEIESPIVLTNTLSVFDAARGVLDYMLALPGNEEVRSLNPLVAECNDGWLNEIREHAVKPEHVRLAIERASDGPVTEGAIGAGTGMRALGWKGGIGTASRQITIRGTTWTVGVLVLANYGGTLLIDGLPVLPEESSPSSSVKHTPGGSAIVVIATDAPVDAFELQRIARRAFLGLARTGSVMHHGSGDYAIAFSVNPGVRRHYGKPSSNPAQKGLLRHNDLNPIFQAVVEATQESVYNALLRADTVKGRDGHIAQALPYDLVVRTGKTHGRPWHIPGQKPER